MNEQMAQSDRVRHGWFSRERGMALVIVVVTLISAYLCYLIALPFLPALAWGLALSLVAHPFHHYVARRIRHPNIAAGASVVLVALVIISPIALVMQKLLAEGMLAAQFIQDELNEGAWEERLQPYPWLKEPIAWLEDNFDLSSEIASAAKFLGEQIPSYLSGSLWVFAQLLITLLVVFYFLRDRKPILSALRHLTPLSEAETERLFNRVYDTVYATLFGSVAVAAVQGALGGLIFWLLELPAPFLWGGVMAVLAMIPMLGTFVVWLPVAIGLALSGSSGKALILLAWGSVAIGFIDNLLYPILVGKKLRMHPLLVFIAVVGGISQIGAAGLILGPVIVSVTFATVEVWRERTSHMGTLESGSPSGTADNS